MADGEAVCTAAVLGRVQDVASFLKCMRLQAGSKGEYPNVPDWLLDPGNSWFALYNETLIVFRWSMTPPGMRCRLAWRSIPTDGMVDRYPRATVGEGIGSTAGQQLHQFNGFGQPPPAVSLPDCWSFVFGWVNSCPPRPRYPQELRLLGNNLTGVKRRRLGRITSGGKWSG